MQANANFTGTSYIGGITLVKNYLANMDKSKSVKICDKIPHEAHEEMRELLYDNSQKKKQRESLGESMRTDLRKSIGDSDEKINESPDVSSGSSDPRRSHPGVKKKLAKTIDRVFIHEKSSRLTIDS